MDFQILTIICFSIFAIGYLFLFIAILTYEKNNKKITLRLRKKEDWLFSGFQETVFYRFYKDKKAEKICGIDLAEYKRYCRLLHKIPCIEHLVALRIESFFILFVCFILAYVVSYNILASAVFLLLGFTAFYLMYLEPYKKIKNEAEEKLFHITDDLPRFLALLEKAMDLPIDQAIKITASKFHSPLSEDLIDSINKVSLGGNGWQNMLIELAHVYDIVIFSDLVLEIVNAYEQGVNIRGIINRKAYEVEQNRLYAVESHDAKIKTLIFLPIMALKVVPLMVLICLPMISEFVV